MWIDQPISHGIKERLSYSPQPQVTWFHPYGEIKNDAKKLNRKHLSNTIYTRKYDEDFKMCDNGFKERKS